MGIVALQLYTIAKVAVSKGKGGYKQLKNVFIMKKLLFSALACAMLLPAVTVQAGGKITWEGRKTNIFGQCVGDAVTVCKEVIINDGGDGRLDPTFPPGDDITIGGGEYIGIGMEMTTHTLKSKA